jgi:peptide/nickel transport system ATP-binding protein
MMYETKPVDERPSRGAGTPIIEVKDLVVQLNSPHGVVRAVDQVSFEMYRGKTLGLVGESGSGKSVLGRSLMGLVPQSVIARREGSVIFEGTDILRLPERELRAYRGNRIAMVFQDATVALHPTMSIGEQISRPMRRHLGLTKKQAAVRAVELLDEVGIADPGRRAGDYPVQLSGGMRQRVMIAIALSCEPEVLVADEPTTALDVTIQRQVLDLLDRLRRDRNLAVLLVSHDLGVIAGRVDEVAVMYAGRLMERGSPAEIFESPLVPYTRDLLRSIPKLDGDRRSRLEAIPGVPPDLASVPPGCAFAPRCRYSDSACTQERPDLLADRADATHRFACWHPASEAFSDETVGGAL